MDFEADVQIGDFRIVRRLGTGGMGVVYLARQVSLDRLVALKVLGPALNRTSDKARFRREALAAARLNHPGIAQVFFVGQDGQVCYMAMEYVEGVSLREVIDRLAAANDPGVTLDSVLTQGSVEAEGVRFDLPTEDLTPAPEEAKGDGPTQAAKQLMSSPVYVRRCCEIVRGVAAALSHAHGQGVVHRDIKPENLLLDQRGGSHVVDFGIARFYEDATLTNTGALVGTPMYMSPEQVAGRLKVDHRTDIYSLGLTLYELLTLRRPITAPTREGVLRQVATKALQPVSWLNRAVSRDLEGVVHKATAKDPDERYVDASAFALDLQNAIARRPVTASSYRYKIDEREISAERPTVVLLICWGFLVMAGFLTIVIIFSAGENFRQFYNSNHKIGIIVSELILLISCFIFILIPYGIFAGRPFSRIAGFTVSSIFSISITIFTIINFIETFIFFNNIDDIVINLYSFLTLVIVDLYFLILAFLLVCPSVNRWFRLCKRIRFDHKQQSSAS